MGLPGVITVLESFGAGPPRSGLALSVLSVSMFVVVFLGPRVASYQRLVCRT